jgi:uncharacterized protein (DUF1778 family)
MSLDRVIGFFATMLSFPQPRGRQDDSFDATESITHAAICAWQIFPILHSTGSAATKQPCGVNSAKHSFLSMPWIAANHKKDGVSPSAATSRYRHRLGTMNHTRRCATRLTVDHKIAGAAIVVGSSACRRSIILIMSVQWPTSTEFVRHKDDVIQIRTSVEAKAILNRAAAVRGQKLPEFMLESARRRAEETILDQRTLFPDDVAHQRFLALLEAPPKPSAKARARFKPPRRT